MSEPKDLKIELSDQVADAMAEDEDLAGALRDMFACMRQAHAACEAGQYETFEDAMEAITGSRPEPVEFDDEASSMSWRLPGGRD